MTSGFVGEVSWPLTASPLFEHDHIGARIAHIKTVKNESLDITS
jgi:hypothetical protein